MGEFTASCQYLCGKTRAECYRDIEPQIGNMNAYGKIIHRKAEGCSKFYKLLSFHDKKDGCDGACCSMECDMTDFDPNNIFEKEEFFSLVKKIMSLNYFNRIK